MDQSTYRSLRQQQPQQSQQQQQQAQNGYEPLPPPSQLGSSSNFRTNTLPPLNVSQSSISQPSLSLSSSTVPASPSTRGYPPPTYNHPSLSNAAAQPLAMAGMASWGHRPSNSRDDFISQSGISPPLRRVESRASLKEDEYERMDRSGRDRDRERERERERDVQIQQDRERREQRERERDQDPSGSGSRDNIKHEGEDGMPSTSDFVKKLYK